MRAQTGRDPGRPAPARVAATGSVLVAAEAKPQGHSLKTKCTVVIAMVTAVTPAQRSSAACSLSTLLPIPVNGQQNPPVLAIEQCRFVVVVQYAAGRQTDGHIVCGVEPSDASPSHNVRNAGAVSEEDS